MRIVESDFVSRLAAVEGAAAIEFPHLRLREHTRVLVAAELSERRVTERIRVPIGAQVGDHQVQVEYPA